MCDEQLVLLFGVERDKEGNAKLVPPVASEPSPEQVFRRKCYLAGVTNQRDVDRLWRGRQAELKERAAKEKGTRKGKKK